MGAQRYYERVKKPGDYSVAKAKQAAGKYPQLEQWKKEFYHCSKCGGCRDAVITAQVGAWPYVDATLAPLAGTPGKIRSVPQLCANEMGSFCSQGKNADS